MRKYLDIDLGSKQVDASEVDGEDVVKVGRYLIAKTLVEKGIATVDALSPENILIFSAGPFAGTSFSNANRTSVGCKSPLTGGIKEANGGGTFGYALGQLQISGFTLYGAAPDWTVIHLRQDGSVVVRRRRAVHGPGQLRDGRTALRDLWAQGRAGAVRSRRRI